MPTSWSWLSSGWVCSAAGREASPAVDTPTETRVEAVEAGGAAGTLGGRARGSLRRRPWHRPWLVILLAVLLLGGLGAVVPFLIPVGPAPGTFPVRELADPDSSFVTVRGIDVHIKRAGVPGVGTPLVLLHGFGASIFSWREVMGALAEGRQVVAFDRPGFGLTVRPLAWTGENPYGLQGQADLTVGLMDELGLKRVILVGHSAGAGVAALVAIQHPERVAGLAVVAPALSAGRRPGGWLGGLARLPQVDHLGPLLMRALPGTLESILDRSYHDTGKITSEVREGYRLPLRAVGWDRGLWEIVKAPAGPDVRPGLRNIRIPTLVVTGDDDRIVPVEESIAAARLVEGAELVIIGECGHIPHEEQPEAFLDAVGPFLTGVQ